MIPKESTLDKVMRLQHGLIARATGNSFDEAEYSELRSFFMQQYDLRGKIPSFVRQCSDLSQFWSFIKNAADTYEIRRQRIWKEFRPVIEYLEVQDRTPGVLPIGEALEAFDPEHVHAAWQKALDRRAADPEGAITAARMLIETVCKHILDDSNTPYPDNADPAKLWFLAAETLNLAPHQHQEETFKSILGNCQSIVNYLAAIRNRVGDAHGQGRSPVKPKARHAELAVNLAGTMAAFLVSTWKERKKG